MVDRNPADRRDAPTYSGAEQADRFFSLLDLVVAWADTAGQPRAMTFRNLCDWVMAGAFPDGSVCVSNGEPVDAEEIYLAGRAATSPNRSVQIGGFFTVWPSEAHMELPGKVIISESGLRAFCHATSTALPPFVGRQSKRRRRRLAAGNAAPPPCAGVEDHAARVIGKRHAKGLLRDLQRQVEDIRGDIRTGDDQTVNEDVRGYVRRRWDSSRKLLLVILSKIGDAELSNELARLDAELEETLVVVEPQADPANEAPSEPEPAGADMSSPSGRRTRTKQYSREKVDNWYKQRVGEFEAKGVSANLAQDWAAAKAVGFERISRDCVRDVRDRLAPAAWKQSGRHPSRN